MFFCLFGIGLSAQAHPSDYSVGVMGGAAISAQNAAGAASTTALGLGLSAGFLFSDPWGLGLEIVTSKPIASVRASSYLLSLDHHAGHWSFSGLLGIQSLIDDRADVQYVDPLTGVAVRKSQDGFSYGLRASYDFVIPISSKDTDLAISPGLRYLRSGGASFYNQFYFLLEFKVLGYTDGKGEKK